MYYVIRVYYLSIIYILIVNIVTMAKRKTPRTTKYLEEQLRKARSQARNEKVKRIAYEEGVKQGIALAKESRN